MAAPSQSPTISKVTLPVAGLQADVYGLSELPPGAASVSCLWLHHGRLGAKEDMGDFAAAALSAWLPRKSSSRGLIAVAFDQRNHGTRLVNPLGNQSWKQGNKTHAQDMFGMVSGMMVDTAFLMDFLEAYLFGHGHGPGAGSVQRSIDHHVALGVSLGGHSVWQTMFAEPRISAGVVVIGCPDYMSLLVNRARLSKLSTFSAADNGESFFGSQDFPQALVAACAKYDPKGILFGTGAISFPTSADEQSRLKPILDARIKGKKFQILSGGADKLVPYAKSKPFLDFFKGAVESWYKEGCVTCEDIVYPKAGHEFSPEMRKDAVRFIIDEVSGADPARITAAKI